MRISPILALAVVGGAVALVAALWDENKPGALRARARAPLSTWEQEMYRRLVEAFPDLIVLAQVALASLVALPGKDSRGVDRKVVDFVLLDRDFTVRAAIELDDESQASRHAVGEPARALLEHAGYRVLEFNRVPEVAQLRALLDGGAPAATTPRPTSTSTPRPAGATIDAGQRAMRPTVRSPRGPAPEFPHTRIE